MASELQVYHWYHLTVFALGLRQWFPTLFFHLPIPWHPISINFTLYICKTFVTNIFAVISNVYVDVCAFFPPLFNFFFFCVPLNVLVRTPGVTRTPGWESLAYGAILPTVVWVHTGPRLCIAVGFLAVYAVMQFVLIHSTYTSLLKGLGRCTGSLQTIDFMQTHTG